MIRRSSMLTFGLLALVCFASATAATTAFSYQGALHDASGLPASGQHDFAFALFDAASGGSQVGSTVSVTAVEVTDGIFNVTLDFGSVAFDGTDLWMEIEVAEAGQSLVPLSPRQTVTPVPLVINADQLGGVDSSAYLTSEVDGDATNELQNIFTSVSGDSGSTTADTTTDTLQIVGSGAITTSISGDTLTINAASDDLGDHTATQNLDLGAFDLVGNGGSDGIAIASDGTASIGASLMLDGVSSAIRSSTGALGFGDDNLTTSGNLTAQALTVTGLDCSANANGGALTTDGSGAVQCSDDDDTQNTLDQAYDEGGAGAGRTIVADNGAVEISGSGGLELRGNSLEQTPGNPSLLASLAIGTNPRAVKVVGRYAYVVDSSSDDLKVVDISNPASPAQVGVLVFSDSSNSPQAIAIAGRYAYVADAGSNDLKIIDISNASAPTEVGSVAVGVFPIDVFVSGHYAFVLDQSDADLVVVNIAAPDAPTVVAEFNIGSVPTSMFVRGRFAYVTELAADELIIIDLINPASPTQVGVASIGASPTSVHVAGRYAYVVDQGSDDLRVVDVANPTLPVAGATLALGSSPQSVFVAGRYAYVVDESASDLRVIELVDPPNTMDAGALVQVGALTLSAPSSVFVAGHYAYVTDGGSDELKVIDISGVEVTSMNAHAATASTLQVRGDVIAQGVVDVANGLSIGAGGLNTNGDVGISGTLSLANDTAPTASLTNAVLLYSEDVGGSAELRVRDEAGNVTTLSPHNFSLIGERSEPMAWAYYSENGDQKINVDMLRVVRAIERVSGERLVEVELATSSAEQERAPDAMPSVSYEVATTVADGVALQAQSRDIEERLNRLEQLLSSVSKNTKEQTP